MRAREEQRIFAEAEVLAAWEQLQRWKSIEDAVRGHRADKAIRTIVERAKQRFGQALDVLADVEEDSKH